MDNTMFGFTAYESKPVTRMAFQIQENDDFGQVEGKDAEWWIDIGPHNIYFKAYQPPVVGDYVVCLTEVDTYHVARDVFRERNIVPDADI